MPADVGTQTVTILFYRLANSAIVNKRFQGIRQTGIYSGGYLSVVDDENCQISTLVCEISDGTNQVRVETAATVNLGVAVATPYVVLRWTYTGAITDYMELLAVASPAANDIVVGLCTFDGSDDLNGFTYEGVLGVNKRTTPNTLDLFLKVEETPTTELRVRIRAGRVTTYGGSVDISDQLSSSITAPVSDSRIDLIYVTAAGAIAIETGVAAASPSVPDYAGKMVLAELTITNGDTNIVQADIKDVRSFLQFGAKQTGQATDAILTTTLNSSYQTAVSLSVVLAAPGTCLISFGVTTGNAAGDDDGGYDSIAIYKDAILIWEEQVRHGKYDLHRRHTGTFSYSLSDGDVLYVKAKYVAGDGSRLYNTVSKAYINYTKI